MTGRRRRLTLDLALTSAVALLIALCAGRIAVWLRWAIGWPDDDTWWWAPIPALGAALALVVVALARTTPATADAYVDGVLRGRLDVAPAPARFGGLLAGVGTGAPLGYEGPMVYFGGALGAFVARRLHRPDRWCILAGATAAVAMVIGAPVAAALFASEVARRGFPPRRDVAPLAIGAAAAWAARRLTGDAGGIVGTDPGFSAGQVMVGALAIGGAAALVGRVIVIAIRTAKRTHFPLVTRVIGVIAVLGTIVPLGWWAADTAVFLGPGDRLRDWAVGASQPGLLLAAVVYTGLVVAMVGCGLVGGLFLPIVSIGAVFGVLLGRAWLPDVPYAACAGIGAVALLAAAYGTSLTAVAMSFALFGWSSTAWLAVVAVVIAREVGGARTMSLHQVPASTPARLRARRPRRRRGTSEPATSSS